MAQTQGNRKCISESQEISKAQHVIEGYDTGMTSCVAGVVMTMDVKAETQKNTSPQECAGCGKKITER